jgi:N6-L-threonylcarbamoyladenine synthase
MLTILGIESSCDDTSAAICIDGRIVSNCTASQKIHENFGGVVPELASRVHQQNIIPTVTEALKIAGVNKLDLDAVAFTRGPGLLGSLIVGSCFAKSFAQALSLPLIDIHHMQAHILAHFIQDPKPEFPFLCLTVSGGHTQIVKVTSPYDMEVLGSTRDDAAGEAFDKIAKLLNLPYPGGPLIDHYAQLGNPNAYTFPISDVPNMDFSFSGLKTFVLYFLQKEIAKNPDFINKNLYDLCASIQFTIVKTLLLKIKKAVRISSIRNIAIAGGVAANSGLRTAFTDYGTKENCNIFIPDFQFCTDNAAMIAINGYYKYLRQDFVPYSVAPTANMAF